MPKSKDDPAQGSAQEVVADATAGFAADAVPAGGATDSPAGDTQSAEAEAVSPEDTGEVLAQPSPPVVAAVPDPAASVGNEVQVGNVYPQSYQSAYNEAVELHHEADVMEASAAVTRERADQHLAYAKSLPDAPKDEDA